MNKKQKEFRVKHLQFIGDFMLYEKRAKTN